MAASEDNIHLYLNTLADADKPRYKQVFLALTQLNNNEAVLPPLEYYIKELYQTDEVLLDFFNASGEAGKRYKQKLQLTYLLLLQSNNAEYRAHLQRCEAFIDRLQLKKNNRETIRSLEELKAYPGKPLKYVGIFAGQWFGARIHESIDYTVSPIVDWMTAINEKRLYWVWGGGLLRTVLSLLPADFFNVQNASTVASAPSQITGYMSWVLYYARFGLNMYLVLRDTFSPDLTDEELALGSATAYWERFKTQWDIRKFTLLNDSIWGIANMVCFFWFQGSDGDALTVALLVFDLFVSVWDFEEQRTLYNKSMEEIANKIIALENELEDFSLSKDEIDKINQKLEQLEKQKIKCIKEWDNKKLNLIMTIVYSLSLTIAFALATLPFLPLAAPTILLIGTIGTVLCFTFTVINNVLKDGLDIKTANFTATQAKDDIKDKIEEFKKISSSDTSLDNSMKILLFMEIDQLSCKSEHQRQLAVNKTMHMIRNIVIQSLVPVLMFVSFVFLPFGAGFGVLAAALALAIVSNLIIERLFTVNDLEFTEFNNNDYEAFCQNPDKWKKTPSIGNQSLFPADKKRDESKNDIDPSLDEDTNIASL